MIYYVYKILVSKKEVPVIVQTSNIRYNRYELNRNQTSESESESILILIFLSSSRIQSLSVLYLHVHLPPILQFSCHVT